MQTTVFNGTIRLCNWIDRATAERVFTVAKLPKAMAQDWDGQSIHLIDWKIDREKQTAFLTYQIRNDLYAPILDCTLALGSERVKLVPPNRSKHWKIKQYSDKWFNTKTGEEAYL